MNLYEAYRSAGYPLAANNIHQITFEWKRSGLDTSKETNRVITAFTQDVSGRLRARLLGRDPAVARNSTRKDAGRSERHQGKGRVPPAHGREAVRHPGRGPRSVAPGRPDDAPRTVPR